MITPCENYPELAGSIGLKESLYFKREDLHPYGSHKGRSIPVMMDGYYEAGDRHFAISSSGNAALAAIMHISQSAKTLKKNKEDSDISLTVFVGNHVSPPKLDKLRKHADNCVKIFKKERPLQALSQAISEGVRSLRQSTDDTALIGYESLAKELSEIKNIGAVFMGVSSGTTAQALAEYFSQTKRPVQIHIVQTSSCHPIADAFQTYEGPEEISLADAIVDKIANRKDALVPLIRKTGGQAWVATNDDIKSAQEITKKQTGLDISVNSALSVVGVMKATYVGYEIQGAIVCLICGD